MQSVGEDQLSAVQRLPHDSNGAQRSTALRWTLALIAAGLAWRIGRYLLEFPIWGDEAFITCGVMDRGYWQHFGERPAYFQVAPLLFLWIERFAYETLGPSEQSLRAFSLTAGCAALLLFGRVAWMTLAPAAAALAVGIFAVGYPLIRHANEAKPYADDVLASMLILWATLRCIERPASWARAGVLTLIASTCIWLSFPAALIAAAAWIGLALHCSNRDWMRLLTFGAGIGASFLTYHLAFARFQSQRSSGSWLEDYWREGFPSLADPWGTLWWLLRSHTSEMMGYPFGGTDFGSTGNGLLAALGLITLLRGGRWRMGVVIAAPFVVSMLAAVLHRYPYGVHARLAQHLAPFICLLMGAGCAAAIGRIRSPRAAVVARGGVSVALLVFAAAGISRDVRQPYKSHEDVVIRDAVEDLRRRTAPGERIAILNPMEFGEEPDLPPQFSATTRHYLKAAGFQSLWCFEKPLPRDVRWVVDCHRAKQPPQRADVERMLADAGLKCTWSREVVYAPAETKQLDVYEVAPSAPP